MRTSIEIDQMIACLLYEKTTLKEFTIFGDNNWLAIDTQIDVLKGIISDEDEIYDQQDAGDIEENVVSAAIDAFQWLEGHDVELCDTKFADLPKDSCDHAKQMKRPCNQCPFRRNSLQGYLGESSYNPEEFLLQLDLPDVHPCHTQVNWESENLDEVMKKAPRCVGSIQFMNNSGKISRYKPIAELQRQYKKNPDVFQWKKEFIDHHKKD
jgi:hypothetical protein